MSNSAFIKSSIAKKYYMALTGLFLCVFLIGHLIGNLQLVVKMGEEGRRAFNEYAYFMTHNPAIMVLSYLTYFSILFHAVDGIVLVIQNKKARPVNYVFNKPSSNSSRPSRHMALLGTLVLIFIATHMSNFWWKMKVSDDIPLHSYYSPMSQDTMFLTHKGEQVSIGQLRMIGEIEGNHLIMKVDKVNKLIEANFNNELDAGMTASELEEIEKENKKQFLKKDEVLAEGYKDLHTVVMQFFSQKNKSDSGIPLGLLGMLFYVASMAVLGFHLWHGFASAFQSLGLNHPKYTPLIKIVGKGYSVIVPFLFAIIPVLIYLNN